MRLLRGPQGKYLIVINPMSRMGQGLRKALWIISRMVIRRIDFDAFLTKTSGHAERIVSGYQAPVDVVVAIGGDGTIQEVINGIMKRTDSPALAVVPAGRGNDFCTMIGIGRSKRKALKYLLSDGVTRVDLLKFDDRYAGTVVGIGLDALIQEKSGHYKYLPVIRYVINAVLLILKGLDEIPMRIVYQGGSLEGRFFVAVVGHTRKYARQIRLFPGLEVDGGIMKFATGRLPGRFLMLVLFFSAGLGLTNLFPQVTNVETPWVEITVWETVKAQSDGDLFYLGKGDTLRVELARNAIAVKTRGAKGREA